MHNLILFTLSTLALLIHPLSLASQNSFSISLDANGAAGDQAITSVNVYADEIVTIQIFGKDIQNANGLAVRFEYDASQVVYEGFEVGDVLPNAQALPEQGTNPTFVEISTASFGGQAAVNSGLVGTIRFRTLTAFSSTAIRLVRADLGRGGQIESTTLNLRVALLLQVLTPDFDGDGRVGFSDFLAFAGLFGARQGDGRYEARYDLDSNGAIGFSDFLIFGSSFGKEVSSPNVDIPDANLRVVIENNLSKARGAPITRGGMSTLTRLEASDANISDLTGLEFATRLETLELSDNNISDVSSLSGLTHLQELYLSYNSISDVSPLSGLTNLIWLHLGRNNISDVSPLSELTSLGELGLPDNNISDVSALSKLTNMVVLELFDNNISDVSALSKLTKLKWLSLHDNNISDVSALSELTNMEWLSLSDNNISNVSPLSGLTKLEELWLHNNAFSDVSPLSGLTNLAVLDLQDSGISDISLLSGLTNLVFLYLTNNNISNVSPLSGSTNLVWLVLSNNNISDVSPLSGLTNLGNLDLALNNISDIAPLVANMGLGSGDRVDVRNNPLSATSINTHIPALQNRGIDVLYDASKSESEKKGRDILPAVREPVGGEGWEADYYIYRR